MELLLLGAGAVVLIAITLWIVWPGRTADAGGNTVLDAEEEMPMSEPSSPGLTPQGAAFEDQYTSATADLSAGGVATALEAMQEDQADASATPVPPTRLTSTSVAPWPPADPVGERIGQAERSEAFPYGIRTSERHALVRPRRIAIGAGVVMSVGSAVGGAWLYSRWQREQNRPINRLRRGAREVAERFGEQDWPPVPIGGAASALLLTGVMLSRARRQPEPPERVDELSEHTRALIRLAVAEALGRGREAMGRDRDAIELGRGAAERGRGFAVERGRGAAERGRGFAVERGRDAMGRGRFAMERGREVAERGSKEARAMTPTGRPFMGLGVGGLAAVMGVGYVIWRMLRGDDSREHVHTNRP